jgi:pyrroline-5-carboxylate reductase
MSVNNLKIGFIGAGNMAAAICGGLLQDSDFTRKYPSVKLSVSDNDPDQLEKFKQKFPAIGTSKDNPFIVLASNVVFLAVKPQIMNNVLAELGAIVKDRLVISIAAGITLKQLKEKLPEASLARVMPNTPCLVGEGMSAVCYSDNVSRTDRELVKDLLSSVGRTLEVKEGQINAITGLSGSGPAFVYEVAKSFIKAGKAIGLDDHTAHLLTAQTILGAGKMLLDRAESPAELVQMVASPGGTTEAGLKVLNSDDNWRNVITDTIIAAKNRADELSNK